jgi:glycosyltransferase involved in cell wall biosynthesis
MNDSGADPPPDGRAADATLARAQRLAVQAMASATAQAMRAGAEAHAADLLRQQLRTLQASLFWRLTAPLRFLVDLARGAPPHGTPAAVRVRRALSIARRQGLAALIRRLRAHLRHRAAQRQAAGPTVPFTAAMPQTGGPGSLAPPPAAILAPCVLIVAELTLQQCAKYRVWQKQEHFARLGVACRVVDWRSEAECIEAAALATQVILYRVPGYTPVLDLIRRLRDLALPIAWEVDDLIFDKELFLRNRNIDLLDPGLREGIVSGVDLYRAAMLACDSGIASTQPLADAMRAAGLAEVAVVENALDEETLRVAARLRAGRRVRERQAPVLITYGSGTNTHNADFLQAAPALLQLLRQRPAVRLRIVGELVLPAGFTEFGDRVERLPPVPYERYLELLSDSDISIAPLEPTLFNDAKSNIKFLEASILEVASVCSPRAHFRFILRDGENGRFAEGEAEWFAALCALSDDAALRARLAAQALASVLDRYAPDAIAAHQVAPLLRHALDRRAPDALRVLFANVYFAPRSYGGATLVTEEMARRLARRDNTEVFVFTSLDPACAGQLLQRSWQDGIPVFQAPVSKTDGIAEFDDPLVSTRFGQVLDAVRPHIVHLHAIQWLGAGLAAECAMRGIPYVVTVHDAWWLCARQFMVTGEGKSCGQTRIDLRVCQNCVPGARHLELRQTMLKAALDGAALILSPGEAHRDLHVANGIAASRIRLAPNGVRLPPGRPRRTASARLRFAFVGGSVEIKGYSIVRRAFEALQRDDWQLQLVDNTLNLGFSSTDVRDWRVRGRLDVVPAYRPDTIDDFFAGIDVLLFPSQWKESFGLTVREALARDVWVIATDGGGPSEAIRDGVNGTLIPLDGRHEPLRAAVEALLDRPGLLAGHRNPLADTIDGFDTQASSLHAILSEIARTAGGTGVLRNVS